MNDAIGKASQRPAIGRIEVTATREPRELVANIRGEVPAGYDVMLVVFENDITTQIAAGNSLGSAPARSRNASMPPAEAPITTMCRVDMRPSFGSSIGLYYA